MILEIVMKEARTVFKGVRFSASEAAIVQRAADTAGQTLAAYVHDAALRESNAHAETERLMEQQRALYEEVVASMERRVVGASAKVLDDALADVTKRMADAQARATADMLNDLGARISSIQNHVFIIADQQQGLVDALTAPATPAASTEPTGPICPVCGHGHMVEKISTKPGTAGKPFYACSAFPACKHSSWSPDGF